MKAMCIFIIVLSLFIYSCEKNSNDTKLHSEFVGAWKLDSVKNKQDNVMKHFPDTLNKRIIMGGDPLLRKFDQKLLLIVI